MELSLGSLTCLVHIALIKKKKIVQHLLKQNNSLIYIYFLQLINILLSQCKLAFDLRTRADVCST